VQVDVSYAVEVFIILKRNLIVDCGLFGWVIGSNWVRHEG